MQRYNMAEKCLFKLFILIFRMEKFTEINTFQDNKNDANFNIFSDKGFKGTVVNRALLYLYGGSLRITLTVPLRTFQARYTFI